MAAQAVSLARHSPQIVAGPASGESVQVLGDGTIGNHLAKLSHVVHVHCPYCSSITAYPEVGRAGGGGATMILPGETEAALRGRNHAEG